MSIPSKAFEYKPIKSNCMDFFYKTNEFSNENPERTIMRCFSILYNDGMFLEAVYSILVEYEGAGVEGCSWDYPDLDSPYPSDHFEGVRFEIGFDDPSNIVYVSEQMSFNYAKKACERFLEIHPEHKNFLKNIIDSWKPLKP